MGRLHDDTLQVAAEHHLVYQLLMRGYDASLPGSAGGDIFACSADGLRVALLRVHVLDEQGALPRGQAVAVARNRACVCVELAGADDVPVYFIVPSALFVQVAVWTRRQLEPHRDAWRLLGLEGPSLRIAS
ncbi:MAG TPA: hypothetical protein VJN18_03345 [Polyangiaceae bacterium]|nr:hypothetical protein [Polyangiaceae bacterium]